MRDLSSLSFGAPAAERDIDQGLDDYFVESEAFKRVVDGDKTIILGNRGMGKSAIFKVLARRHRVAGNIVIELTPEDYSYEMLTSILAKESEGSWAKFGAYAVAWKYLIYVMVMKELVAGPAPRLRRGAAADIYTYLRDNLADQTDTPIGQLISYLKRMEGVKVGKYEAGVRARELQRLYRLEEITGLLPKIAELCSKRHVYVFVDELDRGWDASEDAQAFVAGLFQACASINSLCADLKVYMSLRQELYDSIPTLYEDAQKYRDILEVIAWDEPALLKLIANRIRYTVPALAEATNEEAWAAVFAETLDYRQNKSFNYMVDRTLYRPREIIQFATQAAEMVDRANADSFPVDYSTITRAEGTYSADRGRDIAAEYRFQHPELLSVFEAFRGRVYLFDRSALEDLCLEIATGEIKTKAEWALDMDPERLIEVLWRVGFLRAQAVGGIKGSRRSGSSYVGPHQASNLNLANITRFQVHPMFRAYLGLKEPR